MYLVSHGRVNCSETVLAGLVRGMRRMNRGSEVCRMG